MPPSRSVRLSGLELAQPFRRPAQLGVLHLDKFPRGWRKHPFERIPVDAAREVLTSLRLLYRRDRISAKDSAAKIDPRAMQRADGRSIVHAGTAETLRVRQQVGRKPRPLRRDVEEEGLERRIGRMFRNMPEPALGVLAGLNQMIQYGTFASVGHGFLLTYWLCVSQITTGRSVVAPSGIAVKELSQVVVHQLIPAASSSRRATSRHRGQNPPR